MRNVITMLRKMREDKRADNAIASMLKLRTMGVRVIKCPDEREKYAVIGFNGRSFYFWPEKGRFYSIDHDYYGFGIKKLIRKLKQ